MSSTKILNKDSFQGKKMRKALTAFLWILLMFSLNTLLFSQTQVFFDDFSSGTIKWSLTGSWGLTTSSYHSSSKSLTDSPGGNYTNSQSTSATSISINLSSYLGAQLNFWAKFNLENSFDFVYLEISKDGGTSFNQIAQYNGTSSTWQKYTYNIGGYAGNSNVKIRFRFYSDHYIVADGMYIDDVEVLGLSTDNSAPLIIHQAPANYEGTQNDYNCVADISDVSGINSTYLYYYVDGVGPYTVNGIHVSGNQYAFVIPAQSSGAFVNYKLSGKDNAVPANQTDTLAAPNNKFISGNYLSYDDGNVDEVATISSTSAAAVKITVPSGMYGRLTTVLIRNYEDTDLSGSDMLFHVWSNNNGAPGTDLITPFTVTPEATLSNPFPFTQIDLRSYSEQLTDLTDDFFVGFTVPANDVYLVVSNNSHSRSYTKSGSTWSAYSKDYEIRAIMNISSEPLPVELSSFTASCSNNNVELKWETATELNNYGFDIERSSVISNKSSIAWEKIGFVNGHGNSNSIKNYSYSDKTLTTSGKYLYRLKQLDNDGAFKYSQDVEVNFVSTASFNLSQNYPNPFNPSTTIKYSIPSVGTSLMKFVQLKIYDILGNTVATLVNENKPAGSYEAKFNASQLPSGIYFYKLKAGSFTETKKMMVVK